MWIIIKFEEIKYKKKGRIKNMKFKQEKIDWRQIMDSWYRYLESLDSIVLISRIQGVGIQCLINIEVFFMLEFIVYRKL